MAVNKLFSYTQRDYESSRLEGLKKIPIISDGTWTDLNATDPGIIILDYVHALVDMVQFYLDHQALETFLTTAQERQNVFRLAKQLSYKIRSAKGAVVDVNFYTETLYDAIIKIPKYTSLTTTSGSLEYLTTEDAYLPANTVSVTVPCVQGSIGSMQYTGTGISHYTKLNTSADDSSPEDQTVLLTQKNIDIDSIEITDSLDRIWTPVDYIIFSTSNDYVYEKQLNADGTITIKFGDGERGVVPSTSDTLYIQYVYNLTTEGNVGVNELTTIKDEIYDVNGNPVRLLIENPSASTGGSEPLSTSEIKAFAPGAIKAQERAVTLQDFQNLAMQVAGVKQAIAYDINTAPDLCLFHEVKVVIIPEEGALSQSLMTNVYNYLYQRMIPPTVLQILSPSTTTLNVSVTVVKNASYLEGGIEYDVTVAIQEYFEELSTKVGGVYTANELMSKITNLKGVRYVKSLTPSGIQEASMLSRFVLGTVDVIVVDN